ncbi:AMP-binding protein [Methyloterricola oryzae]|uniref:AMP-binding protein n=1 Tax=Methyloterricola oryzae TaxID=1495050 RepID=UPI000B10DD11|nr:AMP-binding protein [Methyloterricola oryzae]
MTERPESTVLANPAAPIAQLGEVISRGQMWAEARALAAQLPPKPHVFNLCEDRYAFLLTLLAALMRRQVCLLPPSGQAGVLTEILAAYPDAYAASDSPMSEAGCTLFRVERPEPAAHAPEPALEPSQTAAIAFTSGSTGGPSPCPHTLDTFITSAAMALTSLELIERNVMVIATTPAQHMYGLETSIFWPLCSRLIMHRGRPFFPEDIRRAVAEAPLPALLVSTPVHLRALAAAAGPWHNLAGIVSSTAPLSVELARELERVTGVEVREIFGSTETLSFASRRPARESLWRPYRGANLVLDEAGAAWLRAEHLPSRVALSDRLAIQADGRFQVLGRSADMVKIAGKRLSLSELNRRLAEIPGVEDGLCYIRESGGCEPRVHAVVVSPLDPGEIRNALRPVLDPVFLPKRIHYVETLPRQHTGKILKAELDALLERLEG